MSSLARALFALALVAGAHSTGAQAPLDIRALGAPSFESFSARDGLPEGVLVAIAVDAEGVAWAASPNGLYRFLGHRWDRQVDPSHGTVYHRMLLDRAGTLWAASSDKDLSLHDSLGWHFLGRADGVPAEAYGAAEVFDTTGKSRTWLLTGASGIVERRGERWVPDPGNASIPRAAFLTSARTTRYLFGEPRQWIGSGDAGLMYRREGDTAWRRFQMPGFVVGQVEDIRSCVDEHGEALWISSFSQGIYRIDNRGVRRWSIESNELLSNEVYSIALSTDATRGVTAWVGSRRGLIRIHGDVAETFDRRYGLPSDQVRDVHLWRSPSGEEVLWLATENGVARAVFTDERWQTASLMGNTSVGVFGVRVENGPHGERLWLGSYRDGIGLYEDDKWRRFTTATHDIPSNDVRMIKREPDLHGVSALWAGMEPGYLVRIDEGPHFQPIETPWSRGPGQAVLDILGREQDGVRELWIATRKTGIYRWRNDGWKSFTAAGVEGDWRVFSIVEQIDHAGRSWLWAATNQGVARFDGDSWQMLRNVAGLGARSYLGVRFPVADPKRQVLWIGTDLHGLVRLDVTDPMAPFVLPSAGVPAAIDATVYSATGDSKGRVYLCTNTGVQQLTRDSTGWRSRHFGRPEGMVHEECNLNGQFVDAHDRFWTGTLGGLTVFDPGSATARTPRKLAVVGVRIDGQLVPEDSVRLAPGARELSVEYSLRSGQREAETRYRTELIGYDEGPTAWMPAPARIMSALPPGHYRLRIEARDYAGTPSAPAYVTFDVLPAWWQRRTVQAGFAMAIMLLLAGGALWWTRRLRAHQYHLESVVATRTQQLNAANERLVELSYTDVLTGLANRRMFQKQLHDQFATHAGTEPTSLVFIDVDHFKGINDRLGHPAGDEVLRSIATTLQACTPATGLIARYGGEEFACLLHGVPLDDAQVIAERMRAEVEARPIPVPGWPEDVQVTISAGVATIAPESEDDVHHLLRVADLALYRAKDEGRNRVRT
ncbi:ligand-binding sensor domain-containing diguanylate cyclase [soil metagenome]